LQVSFEKAPHSHQNDSDDSELNPDTLLQKIGASRNAARVG